MFLEILAIVLLVLIDLFAAVLLIPFHLTVEASKAGATTRSSITIRWFGIALWRSRAKKRKGAARAKPERFDLCRTPRMLSLLMDAAPSLVGIFKSFRRAVDLRRLSIDLALGVGDPAETAFLAGYLWSVAWAVDLVPRASFSLHPDTERVRLDGSVSSELGVTLLPIIVALLVAFTKKPFRSLIREARR